MSWFRLPVATLSTGALALLGCDRHIEVGEITDGGEGGDPGEEPGEEPGLPGALVFASDFEVGDLSEWGETGSVLTTAGGEITVQGTTVHRGASAALVSTTETGEHVVLSVAGDWTEVLIGFFVNVGAQYGTGNWPILHIDARTPTNIEQLWDVGLDGSSGDGYQVFLWEMPAVSGASEGALAAVTPGAIPTQEWVHLEIHLRAASDDTGFIRLYLDGGLALDLSGRPAGSGDPLHLGFGSFAFGLEPRPAQLFIDDVTVHVP